MISAAAKPPTLRWPKDRAKKFWEREPSRSKFWRARLESNLHQRMLEDLAKRVQKFACVVCTAFAFRDRRGDAGRILVVGVAFEQPPVFLFSNTAPLLEEEWDLGLATLVTNRDHPLRFHWTRTRTTLASDNRPANAGEVELPKVFKKRLDG